MNLETLSLDLGTLRQHYLSGALRPADLVDFLRQKADRCDRRHIWIERLDQARLAPYLDALRDRSPADLPLYGIPFAIKDNIDLAGVPTTAACREFAYTPDRHAFVVARLLAAGAIPLGKTNLDQFATGLVGVRSPFGACENSFNPDYISGGSSSGSAVAVAKGLVSFALGSDTAGSGRVPAAFNNLLGWKPTRGLLSASGMVPACRTLDCVSLLALSPADLLELYPLVAHYDATDCYARPDGGDNLTEGVGRQRTEFTFGVPRPEQLEFFGDRGAAALFAQTVERLQAMGGRRREIDFSPFLAAARLLYQGPWVAERYAAIEPFMQQQPAALLEVTRNIIGAARELTAVAAFQAEYRMQGYRQQAKEILAAADLLVTPTAGAIYTIAEVEAEPLRLNSNLGYYTNFMNLLDCAAVAVPAGFLPNGLPFGITLFAAGFTDRKLLNLATQWQHRSGLPTGATGLPLPEVGENAALPPKASGNARLVVCGAHLSGLPLNRQLTERGGFLLQATTTAPCYRLYALPGGPPHRPGLIRDPANGKAIEVEVWELPEAGLGSLVVGIPAPLGIGQVELADGRFVTGFICEPYGIAGAREITELGSWRRFSP